MKWKQPLVFLLLAALFLFVCWRTLGWYCGEKEILDFIAHRYTVGGQAIIGGKYLYTKGSGLQRYTYFSIFTRDGASHRITVHGYARHDLFQIGPCSRILRVELADGTPLPS